MIDAFPTFLAVIGIGCVIVIAACIVYILEQGEK